MKKYLKKAAIISLAICLALALASCSGSAKGLKIDLNDLYGTYKAVSEQLANENSASMKMTMDMIMETEGQSSNLSMSGPVEYVYNDDRTDLQMYMKLATNMLGGSYDIETWYKDGWAYTDAMGTKIKVQQTMDEMLKSSNTTTVEFPENAIVDQKYEEVPDGTKISFTIEGEVLEAITKKALGNISSDTSSLLEGYTVKYDDAAISCLIDKDVRIKNYEMELKFSMSEGTESFGMSMKLTLSDIVIGDITIDYPSDLDSYTEASA